MLPGATPEQDQLLDELIPPPGPRVRRIVIWVILLTLAAGIVIGWPSGIILPRVGDADWMARGGEGPVYVAVRLRNDSPVDIEVVSGPATRPGLELVGYATGSYGLDQRSGFMVFDQGFDSGTSGWLDDVDANPFPLRIEPGRYLVVSAIYDAADCEAIARIHPADRLFDLQVRRAGGPFGFQRTQHIDMVIGEGSWPYDVARYACGFPEGNPAEAVPPQAVQGLGAGRFGLLTHRG